MKKQTTEQRAQIKTDLMQGITDQIMAAIQDGTAPWQKPWASRENSEAANLASGRAYAGLNRLFLSMLSGLHGCNYWIG